eukprot:s3468_g4.t1
MNGNGPRPAEGKGKKGKGRSVGKSSQQSSSASFAATAPEYDDSDLLEQIRAAMPQAAIIRAQSTLEPQEWDAPTVSPHLLDHRGGIALCPRSMIPEILQRVGYTTMPTAILTSQPAQDFGMKGFPQQRVQCSIHVLTDTGTRERVDVLRWLIQISYGSPVSQVMAGPRVDIYTTMKCCIAKFPARFGWPEKIPANLVSTELQKHVPQDAFSDIVCRESKTASFLLHEEYTECILKASGQGGVFYKLKKQDPSVDDDLLLLWLDESYSLDTALKLAEDATSLGLVEKGSTVAARYAVRFQTLAHLEKFA